MQNIQHKNEQRKHRNLREPREEFWATRIYELAKESFRVHVKRKGMSRDIEELVFQEVRALIPQDESREQLLRMGIRKAIKTGGKSDSGY